MIVDLIWLTLMLCIFVELEATIPLPESRKQGKNSIYLLLNLVAISFDNYRTIHPGILESDSTSSDDELNHDEDKETKLPGNYNNASFVSTH